MRAHLLRTTGVALFGLGFIVGGPALAQEVEADEIVPIADWEEEMAAMYADGWSAERLIDEAAVMSSVTGEEIGGVENVLISPEGRILSVIAEVGGFWDIGDTHVSIPWDQVELAATLESLTVPITEENVEDYGLFGTYGYYGEEAFITAEEAAEEVEVVEDDLATGPRAWRASELIDDYVALEDGVEYGYVDDLIFSQDGDLEAVIVQPDVGYGVGGPYAYPWYGYRYGWEPGLGRYQLPYAEEDVAELETFDYERLGGEPDLAQEEELAE